MALNKTNYSTEDIEKLKIDDIKEEIIDKAIIDIITLARKYMKDNDMSLEVTAKSKTFSDYIKTNINTE